MQKIRGYLSSKLVEKRNFIVTLILAKYFPSNKIIMIVMLIITLIMILIFVITLLIIIDLIVLTNTVQLKLKRH